MTEEIGERAEKWLNDLEEKDPLRAFLLEGIVIILCLLLIGLMDHVLFFDALIACSLMFFFGPFQNGDVLFVIDTIKHCIVVLAVIILMLCFFADLESAWLRLISP